MNGRRDQPPQKHSANAGQRDIADASNDRRSPDSRPGPRQISRGDFGDQLLGADLAMAASGPLANSIANSIGSSIANSMGSEGLNAKVLVLNKLYVAMRVISARRAFCLLVNNIAEVIHVDQGPSGHQFLNYDFESWAEVAQLQRQFEPERHDWVRTVRYEIAVPRIIRLIGYDRLPDQIVKLNRRNLFARDRNLCQYCGRVFPTADLSIDHVKPRAQGGGNTWDNLVCACIRCNARKGGRTPEQARMSLVRRPEKPKRNPLITLRLGHEKYASWKAFLDHAYWSVELK